MANKFIHYLTKNGAEYAYIYTPQKVNGKKDNAPEYLGRVIDKGSGIFKSRKRGLFTYDIVKGYGEPIVMSDIVPLTAAEKLILDFGDAYFLFSVLKRNNLYRIMSEVLKEHFDTLMSLLGFKLLSSASNFYAEDWWEGSYARILFPNPRLKSQRISEFYQELGSEELQRKFFNLYLHTLCEGKRVGVLIDSTGLPNDIHFPLTAISTHNGVTSNEARLILVVDRKTEMPLFFRYNAGNIVDVTTLRSTILELEAFGIETDFAILDAGYYSEDNIKDLYGGEGREEAIPFLTRLGSNRKIYKQLVLEHADDLSHSKYMVMQRERLLSIKRVEIELFGNVGYAYISIDHARREEEIYKYAKSAIINKDLSYEEMDVDMKSKGLFILISSEKIETSEIMPLYYTRQVVEQIFDISKNNADLLPLRVHNEATFRGHLMLSFMATIVYLVINQMLENTRFHANGAFVILRNQKCKVFEDHILPKEPNKKMNDIYKKVKLASPTIIPIGSGNN